MTTFNNMPHTGNEIYGRTSFGQHIFYYGPQLMWYITMFYLPGLMWYFTMFYICQVLMWYFTMFCLAGADVVLRNVLRVGDEREGPVHPWA